MNNTRDDDRFQVELANEADVDVLLDMMDDFNRYEAIVWSRAAGEPALRALIRDRGLGVVGLFRERDHARVVVGYFVLTFGYDLEWNGRDAFLTELYLLPDRRSRGFGPDLVAAAERIARDHGAHALHLMVRTDNERARRLYVAAGFRSPPRLFMTKVLSPR